MVSYTSSAFPHQGAFAAVARTISAVAVAIGCVLAMPSCFYKRHRIVEKEPKAIATPPPLPQTPRQLVKDLVHGVAVEDPYRWLEEGDNPRVQEWDNAQDAVARAVLAALPGRQAFRDRLKELLYVGEKTAPMARGDRVFVSASSEKGERLVHYWASASNSTSTPLIDFSRLGLERPVNVPAVNPSPMGTFAVVHLRPKDTDWGALSILEVETGIFFGAETIPNTRDFEVAWLPDESGFYYRYYPPTPENPGSRMAHGEVRFHRLGESSDQDTTVWRNQAGEKLAAHPQISDDGRLCLLTVKRERFAWDVYARQLGDGLTSPWRPIVTGTDATYVVRSHEGRVFLLTNYQASRYQVLAVDYERDAPGQPRTFLSPDERAILKDIEVFGGNLLVHSILDVHSELNIYSLSGDFIAKVTLPGLGQVDSFVGTAQSRTAYFTYQSFGHPKEVFAVDMETGAIRSYFRPELPLDPTTISVQQGFATSVDGTRVPLFVVHKRDFEPSASAPTILEGYGGFGYSLLPRFSRSAVTWVETGGVYAIANLRGGSEYGEQWHRAGKLANKQNVFDDFYAAARWLVEKGYASHETLGAWGGSNGGLLVGAAITQQPHLFKAVVSIAPVLDMVRFPDFGVGGAWVTEYGDPSRKEDFGWLHAYSPYHNVKPNEIYPSTLLFVFKNDDRVDPMHARKFAAALQHGRAVPDRPILMRVQPRAGHAGGDARAIRLTRAVDELTFFHAMLNDHKDGCTCLD